MKIYVDELPKNCVNCDFGYANNFCYIDYEIDLRKFDKNTKHPNCPLQSLADHDKQVRKEVIDKVYEVLEQAIPHDLCWSWAVIEKELNQIQGENND